VISPDLLADIEVVDEEAEEETEPFVKIRKLRLRHRYRGNRYSSAYVFYLVESRFVDAVAVMIYTIDADSRVLVGLRRGVRPAIYLRRLDPYKAQLDKSVMLVYREIVAGGIEQHDLATIGVKGRACLEVREEAGFEVAPEDLVVLGEGTFSSPASGKEKLHYLAVRVELGDRRHAPGDGHPLEEVGDFEFHELAEAISWCRSGEICDSKTEIGLYRLANYLGYHPELGVWTRELPAELRRRCHSLGLMSSGIGKIGTESG